MKQEPVRVSNVRKTYLSIMSFQILFADQLLKDLHMTLVQEREQN